MAVKVIKNGYDFTNENLESDLFDKVNAQNYQRVAKAWRANDDLPLLSDKVLKAIKVAECLTDLDNSRKTVWQTIFFRKPSATRPSKERLAMAAKHIADYPDAFMPVENGKRDMRFLNKIFLKYPELFEKWLQSSYNFKKSQQQLEQKHPNEQILEDFLFYDARLSSKYGDQLKSIMDKLFGDGKRVSYNDLPQHEKNLWDHFASGHTVKKFLEAHNDFGFSKDEAIALVNHTYIATAGSKRIDWNQQIDAYFKAIENTWANSYLVGPIYRVAYFFQWMLSKNFGYGWQYPDFDLAAELKKQRSTMTSNQMLAEALHENRHDTTQAKNMAALAIKAAENQGQLSSNPFSQEVRQRVYQETRQQSTQQRFTLAQLEERKRVAGRPQVEELDNDTGFDTFISDEDESENSPRKFASQINFGVLETEKGTGFEESPSDVDEEDDASSQHSYGFTSGQN